jgi:hypothetical protein
MPYEWVKEHNTTSEIIYDVTKLCLTKKPACRCAAHRAAERLGLLDAQVLGLRDRLKEAEDSSIVISSSDGEEICVIDSDEAQTIVKLAVQEYVNTALRMMIEQQSVIQSAHGQEHDGEDRATS